MEIKTAVKFNKYVYNNYIHFCFITYVNKRENGGEENEYGY